MAADLARTVAAPLVLAMFTLIACLAAFLREVFLAVTDGSHRIR
jgi:hypothetical protein